MAVVLKKHFLSSFILTTSTLALAGCQTIELPSFSRSSPPPAQQEQTVSSDWQQGTPQAQTLEGFSSDPSQSGVQTNSQVQSAPLNAPDGQSYAQPTPAMASTTPAPSNTTLLASAPAGAADVGRDDLVGGWTIQSGSLSCKLFLNLTSWTGGYRATARNCPDQQIASITAWNLENRLVTLSGAEGDVLARLYAANDSQFVGQFTNGQPVSFSR
jgi:hypothetical protein